MTTLAPPANCEPQIPGVGMVPYRPFRGGARRPREGAELCSQHDASAWQQGRWYDMAASVDRGECETVVSSDLDRCLDVTGYD